MINFAIDSCFLYDNRLVEALETRLRYAPPSERSSLPSRDAEGNVEFQIAADRFHKFS